MGYIGHRQYGGYKDNKRYREYSYVKQYKAL